MIECNEKRKRHINNGEMVNILFKLRNKENLTIVTVFFFVYSIGRPNKHKHMYEGSYGRGIGRSERK